MLENIVGAANSQGNTIIWGETLEELQNKPIKVFKSIRKQGLRQEMSTTRNVCSINLKLVIRT